MARSNLAIVLVFLSLLPFGANAAITRDGALSVAQQTETPTWHVVAPDPTSLAAPTNLASQWSHMLAAPIKALTRAIAPNTQSTMRTSATPVASDIYQQESMSAGTTSMYLILSALLFTMGFLLIEERLIAAGYARVAHLLGIRRSRRTPATSRL